MEFDPEDDYGPFRAVDPSNRLVQGRGQVLRVALRDGRRRRCRRDDRQIDRVARQLDVDGQAVVLGDFQHAVDFRDCALGVVEHGRGSGELLKDAVLGVIRTDFVVNERMPSPLFHARSAADHHDRRLLRIGLPGRVGDLEAADSIGDGDHPEPVEPRIRIGGKPCSLFIACGDQPNRALLQFVHEGEHEVPRHAENVADSMIPKPSDEITADRGLRRLGHRAAPGHSPVRGRALDLSQSRGQRTTRPERPGPTDHVVARCGSESRLPAGRVR